jgi:hypothetical protein
MLRDGRKAHWKRCTEFGHGCVSLAERHCDLASRRVGECLEDSVEPCPGKLNHKVKRYWMAYRRVKLALARELADTPQS